MLSFRRRPESIPAPESAPSPFCMRLGAQGQSDQGERLSEALAEFERDPDWHEHRSLPLSVSEGDADSGVAFSFAYFSFGEAKEK
jgi:hypothetical protein